ncbi:MAG TPA: DUF3300 domain-containing protein [Acetobacteraceae bacterium]|nr:DUF3300 domain-containing protein [Acetobacteraceae bacterium]
MRGPLFRGVAMIAALALAGPPPAFAQMTDAPPAQAAASQYPAEQLDALLAPIALYPDALLTQILMAATFPLQVVEASRWLEDPANKALQGDALAQALDNQPWDPSIKSLVPFPQVLAMLNSQLEWMQQLGWAFAGQQADVMASIQRLRHQAQANGSLQSNQQQRVTEADGAITIEPASPQIVFVPVYTPQAAYGEWPAPAYPPVYIPPPADYALDSALYGGLGFAAGAVVVGSLFGFAHPHWHKREVHLDMDRFNRLNVNRMAIQSQVWRPPAPAVQRQVAIPAVVRPTIVAPPVQMARPVPPVMMPQVVPWGRPMQPIVRGPVYPAYRPVQPVMRPPVVVQRPAVVPQRGGFQRPG